MGVGGPQPYSSPQGGLNECVKLFTIHASAQSGSRFRCSPVKVDLCLIPAACELLPSAGAVPTYVMRRPLGCALNQGPAPVGGPSACRSTRRICHANI